MPCWFYEKKDLRNTASYQDGISPEVEARYRREGARFILDAGSKMGLYPFSFHYLSKQICKRNVYNCICKY